jgi:hypothetical protein
MDLHHRRQVLTAECRGTLFNVLSTDDRKAKIPQSLWLRWMMPNLPNVSLAYYYYYFDFAKTAVHHTYYRWWYDMAVDRNLIPVQVGSGSLTCCTQRRVLLVLQDNLIICCLAMGRRLLSLRPLCLVLLTVFFAQSPFKALHVNVYMFYSWLHWSWWPKPCSTLLSFFPFLSPCSLFLFSF